MASPDKDTLSSGSSTSPDDWDDAGSVRDQPAARPSAGETMLMTYAFAKWQA